MINCCPSLRGTLSQRSNGGVSDAPTRSRPGTITVSNCSPFDLWIVSSSTYVSGRGCAGAYSSSSACGEPGKVHRRAGRFVFHVAEGIEVGMCLVQFPLVAERCRAAEGMPGALDGVAQSKPPLFVEGLLQHRQATFEPAPCLGSQLLSQRFLAQQARDRRMPVAAQQHEAIGQRQAAPRRAQHADPRGAVAQVRQRAGQCQQVEHGRARA